MKNNVRLPHFQTKNLIFRSLKLEDKFDIYYLYSDPNVVKLDVSDPINSLEAAEELIRKASDSSTDPHSIHWGVELKETNRIVGTCGYKNWNRVSNHAEIGGNLASEFWGKGLATEGLKALLDYGFVKMNLNKIYASTNCQNISALKLMKKYGFCQEGRLREHQLLDDQYYDVFIFSLLYKDQ
ncbi:GNAT family N-acetyltransferase [Evansella sp. AB-rgal1]|uniref:GNAT family N-acetyltransferase n=1 Tax=Evansella sp. AB-rgal1 TaxID=3242696 RepID=UPI00359DA29D